MTVDIPLAPEEEARLHERAAAERKDVLTVVREAVLEKINRPSLSELLAPIHAATEAAGLTEDDIDALIERGRREVHEERQRSRRL